MSTNKSVLVVQEIDEILKKCVIKTFQEDGIHFLNSIFVVPKMESEGRPMLYLKILLKKLYVRLIIFPKGILLMASSKEETCKGCSDILSSEPRVLDECKQIQYSSYVRICNFWA